MAVRVGLKYLGIACQIKNLPHLPTLPEIFICAGRCRFIGVECVTVGTLSLLLCLMGME